MQALHLFVGEKSAAYLCTVIKTKTKMETRNIYNLIILDESGSMSEIAKKAVSAMNETIQGIKKAQKENPEQHYYISLVTFEGDGTHGVKTVRDRIPADRMETLKQSEYHPCGCTPLYDAMGSAICHLRECVGINDPVLVTVITDGEENSSHEFSGKTIKDLVERQREAGWSFAYIGANQDAIEVARGLNITNSVDWFATDEGAEEMTKNLRRCVSNFCEAAPTSCGDMDDLFKK